MSDSNLRDTSILNSPFTGQPIMTTGESGPMGPFPPKKTLKNNSSEII